MFLILPVRIVLAQKVIFIRLTNGLLFELSFYLIYHVIPLFVCYCDSHAYL